MTRLAAMLLGLAALAGGCGSPVLRGKVVEGGASGVVVVEEGDSRFISAGVGPTKLRLTLDPRSLGRKIIAETSTGPDGNFAIPIREFGAGMLEYEFELLARSPEHDSAVGTFRLPRDHQRILVILRRGPDRYKPDDNPLRDAEPYLNKKQNN